MLGKRHLWQIAIKPGRPMSFGQIGDCVVLGLPGNPVAVFVCFLLYVRPVLAVLAGGDLARAGAISARGCVLTEKKGRKARVLARAALEKGWAPVGDEISTGWVGPHFFIARVRWLDRSRPKT